MLQHRMQHMSFKRTDMATSTVKTTAAAMAKERFEQKIDVKNIQAMRATEKRHTTKNY